MKKIVAAGLQALAWLLVAISAFPAWAQLNGPVSNFVFEA
jgi:hypothetical protein